MLDDLCTDDRKAWEEFLLRYSEGNIDDTTKPDIKNIDRYLAELGGWLAAPLRQDEKQRLAAFNRYASDILQAYKDAGSDLKLDTYTRLAATMCDTPISLLNLLDSNTQWVTSEYGLSSWRNATLPRSHTFCAHTILRRSREVFVVTDAKNDWRFAKMPMVCGPPFVQWYMGAPLTTSDGQNIGALCVLDTNADRPLPTDRQKQVLIDLADVIMRELDLRADRLVARKAKKVFLSSINHELRSPLHGLLASAELLVDDGHLTPFQDVCTRTITNCGKTLCDVIEHVLSVSDGDQQPRALEQVDLLDFVEEVLDATWAGKAKLKLKESPLEVLIKVNLTHLRHPFLIDRGELGRIIMNIFGNAIKYTSKGYLSVNVTATDPPFNSGGRRRQVVTMIFEDTGKGIDETFMCNLFTPFMQENGQCDGVGLGMSMVKQLIEKNGGTIDVKSVRGKGTTVTVTLLLVAIKPEKSLAEGQLSKEEFQSLCGLRFAIFQNVGRVSDVLYNSLIETCESVFGMNQSEIDTAELILLVDPHDLAEFRQRDLSVPIVIFAPEVPEAHPRCTMFLQVPVGPNKLGRAIKTAIEHHEQSMYSVRRSSIVHLDPISPPTSAPLKQFDPMSICSYLDAKEDTRGQSQTTASSPMSELSSFSFGRPRIEPLQTIPDETDLSTISSYSRESRPYCLCVDDNQINIRILAALLRKKGLEFDTAADGQEAVDKFISSPRPFDLTFMDINMPTLDGISATKQIREHEKETGKPRSIIAALTGGGELDQNNIEELGLDYFFQKPVSIKQLSDFLKAHEHDFNDGSP